tara:strand:- start:3250 stop:3381 length:132 start_codon:yes stop_codon:yes gene_type:complete
MKKYKEIIRNLRKTIARGGSKSAIDSLKRTLKDVEKKSLEDFR